MLTTSLGLFQQPGLTQQRQGGNMLHLPTLPEEGGWRQVLSDSAPQSTPGAACSSAWGQGRWASVLHDVAGHQKGILPLVQLTLVTALAGWSQGTHRFPVSTGNLFHISHLLLCSAFLQNMKAQIIPSKCLTQAWENTAVFEPCFFTTLPHPCPLRWDSQKGWLISCFLAWQHN